jgi:hypothetical protein
MFFSGVPLIKLFDKLFEKCFVFFEGTNIEYAFEKIQIEVEPTYAIFFFLKKKKAEREWPYYHP